MDYRSNCEGSWGIDGPGQPQLTFSDDGRVTGTDGCNRLMGRWGQTDDCVHLMNMASTMMYCEGVDTWLRGADTVQVHGDTLYVMDQHGQELGTLDKQ